MAKEIKTEDRKFIKYWLKHTEAPVTRTTLGTGAVEVSVGDITETTYWYHESTDEIPNSFVDDIITTGKDCKGTVDEKFWTQTDEETYAAETLTSIREDVWQINTDKVTDTEGVLDVEYTHEYSWSTYDGTKDVEYRVAGVCKDCKFYKPNTEIPEEEPEPDPEPSPDPEPDNEPDPGTEPNDPSSDPSDPSGDPDPTPDPDPDPEPEPTPTPEPEPEPKPEKKGDDYWLHHLPHRCHRLDWRKVCMDGMCTKVKKVDYIDGKETNSSCFERNYYGECPDYEPFEEDENTDPVDPGTDPVDPDNPNTDPVDPDPNTDPSGGNDPDPNTAPSNP